MKVVIRAAALSACSIALATLARAENVDIKWNEQGHFENHIAVQHGKLVEACAKLVPGDRVKWSFTSRDAVDFNVHYHQGHEVKMPAKQDGTQKSEGTLEVSSAQDYCWMWSTKGANGLDVQFALDKSH